MIVVFLYSLSIYLIVMGRVIELKHLIFVAKSKGQKPKTSQTDDMEIRYNMIVLNVTIFCI